MSKATGVVHKRRNIGRHKPVQHAAGTDQLARKDARIDRRLRIVPHDATNELHSGGDSFAVVIHVDDAISVFQVAVASART